MVRVTIHRCPDVPPRAGSLNLKTTQEKTMHKLTSALGVTALATLQLGLAVPSALADNARAVVASCSEVFGPDC